MNKRSWFFGFTLGLLSLPFLVVVVASLGLFPVATNAPALPGETFLAHLALHSALKKVPEPLATAPNLSLNPMKMTSAARSYLSHCAGCHGLPVTPDSKMARAMFPRAPQFFQDSDRLTDDRVSELHWKIKNGIRLSGMPAYQSILTDDEMWELAWLLKITENLPPDAKQTLDLKKTPSHPE